MSQQASYYYHIDTDGNYWFPLFPDAETAISADGTIYGSTTPGAHEHEFGGAIWYMPNTMASADNDFIGSFHAANLSADDVTVITEDGAVNITTFSFDSGGDGSSGVDPIPDDNNGSSANANLVVNGSFDSQDAWFGNALNAVNGVNEAFVEQAGNVFDVNLSQQVSLSPGADYTLSFQVSGTEGRSIVAGIGMNEDPWFANVQTINLTESGQEVTLHLTAFYEGGQAEFGGDNSRVIFDMGGDVGAVNIDNVSLVSGHVGTAGFSDISGGLDADGDSGAPSYDTKYELQPGEVGYTGTDGADAIKFGIGDNQLVNGGAGDDFIYSYSGTGDVLVGSSGNDVLQVRTLREVIEVAAGEFPEVVVTSAVTTHSYGNDFPMGLFGFVITGTDIDFSSVDITATVRGPNGEAQIFPYSAEGAGFISAGSLNDKTMIVVPSGLASDVVNGAYFDIIALDPDPGSYELLNVTASQNGNTIASVEPEGVYFEIIPGQGATTPSTTFYYDSVAVAYGSEPVTQVFGGDIDENGNPTNDDSDNDTLFLTGLSQDYSIARGTDTDAGEVILRNNLTGGTVIAKQIENFTFQFGYNQETIALNDLPIDARLQTELEYQENPGPVIEAVLPTADLVNLVPEFADVGDANLDLPLVLRNKPTGEAYIELGAPVAETDALYLYVAEWQGESIILGSPKNYYSEALVKLNLAADPIAQNTNFEIDVDFYTSFATGEIRSFEALSQYIDDPDNAFGLGPLEILDRAARYFKCSRYW